MMTSVCGELVITTTFCLKVLLDSLVKPEEVLEPDEDLDDAEGELHNLGWCYGLRESSDVS